MLYVLGYIVSTFTRSSSGRWKNFERKLQNLVIFALRFVSFTFKFLYVYGISLTSDELLIKIIGSIPLCADKFNVQWALDLRTQFVSEGWS
jgi:hypothetical protein